METRRLVVRLLLAVAGSFAFGFAMVPLYDVLCKATGLNGKSDGWQAGGLAVAAPPPAAVDRARSLTVEFTGTVMPGLPWEMHPATTSVDIHPGELQQVSYVVHNKSDHPIVGQAVPSVSPGLAAQHFQKLDCFCFTRQTLAPGESRAMPLVFVIRPEIDREIRQITLSYAFYRVDDAAAP